LLLPEFKTLLGEICRWRKTCPRFLTPKNVQIDGTVMHLERRKQLWLRNSGRESLSETYG